jgi:hypothetical protein
MSVAKLFIIVIKSQISYQWPRCLPHGILRASPRQKSGRNTLSSRINPNPKRHYSYSSTFHSFFKSGLVMPLNVKRGQKSPEPSPKYPYHHRTTQNTFHHQHNHHSSGLPYHQPCIYPPIRDISHHKHNTCSYSSHTKASAATDNSVWEQEDICTSSHYRSTP